MNDTTSTREDLEPDEGLLDVDEFEVPVTDEDTDNRYPCFIAGSTLIVRLEEAGEMRIPLKLSYNQIEKLRESISDDSDELDQLLILLGMLGDDDLLERLKDIDMADALAVAILYFRAWKQRTRVSLGKLRGSSRR